MEPRLLDKKAWKGVVIAIIAVVAGQLVLAWQYYRLEEKRLPLIEQQLVEQKEEIEKQSAKDALASFLSALEEGNEKLALRFLTENAVVQEEQGMFSLEEKILGYNIIRLEQISLNSFRAQVEIENGALLPEVRLVYVLKILDTYYIDSIAVAG